MPGSCAAGVANLKILEEEDLVANSAAMGEYILGALSGLKDHPMVGDIRGLGMIWGIEIVKDKATKEPIHRRDVAKLSAKLSELGLITRCDNGTIRFMPPLIMTREEVDESIGIIDLAIGQLEAELLS
jgi:adenosylmethionine-8-amino-7-oxononanoate aminotransferase